MNTKEIFSQLLCYFPEGEEARLYGNMRAFGEACLAAGDFAGAEEYADLLLAQDKNTGRQIAAYRIKLFAKLRCRTNEEFRHCAQFSKEMPEYEELIAACEADDKKLAAYINLAKDNAETVAADVQKRAAQEECERIRREKKREAEEARLQKIKEEQQRIEAQKETEKREEIGRVIEWFKEHWGAALIVGCIIFGIISFIAGWVEGGAGAFIALIFVIILIRQQ